MGRPLCSFPNHSFFLQIPVPGVTSASDFSSALLVARSSFATLALLPYSWLSFSRMLCLLLLSLARLHYLALFSCCVSSRSLGRSPCLYPPLSISISLYPSLSLSYILVLVPTRFPNWAASQLRVTCNLACDSTLHCPRVAACAQQALSSALRGSIQSRSEFRQSGVLWQA